MQDFTQPRISPFAATRTGRQAAGILLIALVAGSTFGIWRGYNPTGYSATTFLEMHQGAVRGLNTLLPAMGAAALLLTATLVFGARSNRRALPYYILTLVLMTAAALVTRFGNQPINAIVMSWTPDTIPDDWAALLDRWWIWHVLRTACSAGAVLLLTLAVFADRAAASPR
jgi:uncharacterized membrane protein